MINKELLQYGISILVVLGLLGLVAQKAQAEDQRLDMLCGSDRSGCVTQVHNTTGGGIFVGAYGGGSYVEYSTMTPTP